MTKTEQLNALFAQWEAEIPAYKNLFVKDGIINESQWNVTNPKILFITKEPNHYENPRAGDFREEWSKGDCNYPFAYRIAEWAFGIIQGFPEFISIRHPKDLCHEYLQKIAFMNIKKLGGGSNAIHKNLVAHLKVGRHCHFIREQIRIIDPDLIILGFSSHKRLIEMVFPDIKLNQCGYYIEVAKLGKSKVIDFYHPSSRTGPPAAYSLLQNVINSNVFKELY